ncbi:MAG: DUF1961 family protein [bacterium]|nr:DUF1961 family protein [bacterium]
MRKIPAVFVFLIIAVISGCNSYQDSNFLMSESNPVGNKGTISFILQTDETYKNGLNEGAFEQELFRLPGLGTCSMSKGRTAVDILFMWEGEENLDHCMHMRVTELPGPESYFIQFTWDADKGIFNGYFNGGYLRYPGTKFEPWEINGLAATAEITPGVNRIIDLKVLSKYSSENELQKNVPEDKRGKHPDIMSLEYYKNPIDISSRKGSLIYNSELNDENSITDWVLEGPGIITFENGQMIMRSEFPDTEEGHFNYWCPKDIPGSFILEWEYSPMRDLGFNHIFFAAKGLNGEDIFDETLPERDGTFRQYLNGSINNYFISYYSHLPGNVFGRPFGYLQKNLNFLMLQRGPIAIKQGAEGFHKLRLVKDGSHIQFLVDGKLCIDYNDIDTERYGPAHTDGKIGFRQMSAAVGAYRNLNVWELLDSR